MSFSILTICHHPFTAFCIEKQGEVRKSIIDALKSVQTTPVGSSTNGAMKDLKLEEGKKSSLKKQGNLPVLHYTSKEKIHFATEVNGNSLKEIVQRH